LKILKNLEFLTFLNKLSGSIPSTIGEMNLQDLEPMNRIVGELPVLIGKLAKLEL
jgi:hypothetical protein